MNTKIKFAGGVVAVMLVGACGDKSAAPSPAVTAAPAASAPAPSVPAQAGVSDWGPQSTDHGVVFNRQPNGKAALWIRVNGPALGPNTQVLWDGKPLEDVAIAGVVVTGAVPADLYATAGKKTVVVQDPDSAVKVPVGTFDVK